MTPAPRPGWDERGLSLPELLVAMLLFSLLVVGWSTFEVATHRGLSRSLRDAQAAGGLENACENLRQDIRRSSLFLSSVGDVVAGEQVLILQTYGRYGSGIVVWTLDGEGNLLREFRPGAGEPGHPRPLARGVRGLRFDANEETGTVRVRMENASDGADFLVLARNYDPPAGSCP